MNKKRAVASRDELAMFSADYPTVESAGGRFANHASADDFYPLHIDSIATPTFIVDVLPGNRFVISAINTAHEKMTGLSSRQIVNKPLEECLPEGLAAKLCENYMSCVISRKPCSYEEVMELPGGELYFRTVLSPQFGPSGDVIRLFGQTNDITVEKQTFLSELEKYSALRQKLTDFQDTFLTAAHDLRSPLCQLDSLMKLLQLRLAKCGGKEELDLLALSEKLIGSSIYHLDDVLGQIEGQHMTKSEMGCFDLGRVCSEIHLRLDPLQKVRIKYDSRQLVADSTLVHTTLFNLVDNAIKHNLEKNDLLVKISVNALQNNMLEFSVSDNGKGIGDLQLNAGKERVSCEPGKKPNGFGLYSIRRIIASHDGSFELDSSGKGLTVRFTLPGRFPAEGESEDETSSGCAVPSGQVLKWQKD